MTSKTKFCALPSESARVYLAKFALHKCPRHVIPGQDQGSYLHELHNADEATCKLQSQDSWSQPGMTTRKPTAKYYTFVLFIKRRAVLYASADAKHRKEKRMSNLLEHAFVFSMYSFVLMFFCLNKVYPRKTAQRLRHVIPGQDQGPHLNNCTLLLL